MLRSALTAALGCALISCTVKPAPGSVTSLPLTVGSSVTSASLGLDGRLWFGYLGADAGPGLGSVGLHGVPNTIELAPMAYGYAVDDVAITPTGTAWLALACYPSGSKCSAGYARFPVVLRTSLKVRRIGNGRGEPDGVSLDRDGSAWISDHKADAVVHIGLDGKQTVWAVPDPRFAPIGVLATARALYLVGDEPGKICRFDRHGKVAWIPLPDPKSRLSNLAAAPDGTIWVAEYDADRIVSIAPDDSVRSYAVPTADAHPDAIAVDERGAVWFTEIDTDKLGTIGQDGVVRETLLPYTLSGPLFVFAGPSQTLYVLGMQSHWFGLYRTFVVATVAEATAFQ